MSILETNARELFTFDGDFIGYALPEADPVSIDTRWASKWDRDDVVTYVVTWADGTVAEMFTFRREWNHILHETAQRRHVEAGRKLAATLVGEAA